MNRLLKILIKEVLVIREEMVTVFGAFLSVFTVERRDVDSLCFSSITPVMLKVAELLSCCGVKMRVVDLKSNKNLFNPFLIARQYEF